ncbi:type 1 glutamine amidotransferase [Planctomonas psychrotolerans]|uniref:type 1 glutamine amidotransferase n=1 Tax=Planctomonas psychrotolerans TaxID=2528712 RepID=UPI001238475E|nr:glutamine amidotransferase [Planctomonas psychrotolerans]
MTELRILHLYPRELGINGDRGNVLVLRQRAERRGIAVTVLQHDVAQGPLPDADLVFVGSGPLSAQRAVHADLLAHAGRLRELAESGAPFLAVAGGMQLLGERITLLDGSVLDGAGVLPVRTRLVAQRSVGDIVVDTPTGVLVGFENHGSTLEVTDDAVLGRVRRGFGNTGAGGGEGVRIGSLVGTHLNGPVLALNPSLADELLAAAIARTGTATLADEQSLTQLDEWASRARATIDA